MSEEPAATPTPIADVRSRTPSGFFRSKTQLSIALLVCLVASVVGLLYLPLVPPKPSPGVLDDAALARSVTSQCAMGMTIGRQDEVSAGLQKFFSGLQAGAKVTTSDVGAIADKVAPTGQGVDLYKAYTDCLKAQTTLILNRNGVAVVAPDQSSLERQKDDAVRRAINDISPETPREKLVEIFGSPLSSSKTEWSRGMTVDIYRYKYSAFAYDYRNKGNRVAIVLATKDPLFGQSMIFEQIDGKNIVYAFESCGGVIISARGNARSKVCPAFGANNYLASILVFPMVKSTELVTESHEQVCQTREVPDPKVCPGFASVPALSIVMTRNSDMTAVIDARLSRVASAFIDELDFSGGSVRSLSEEEGDAYEKVVESENSMTPQQLDAFDAKQTERRARLYKALVH